MNSILELVLHLHAFKNVDLFRQGVYAIRGSFSTATSGPTDEFSPLHDVPQVSDEASGEARNAALPYHVLPSHVTFRSFGGLAAEPMLEDGTFAFRSRSFRVQYCEQIVHLDDGCVFRLEVDTATYRTRSARASSGDGEDDDDDDFSPIVLKLELLFYEYSALDAAQAKAAPGPDDLEVVSTLRVRLADVFEEPVHAFYPFTFDDMHYGLVTASVHSMLVDFRFRPRRLHLSREQRVLMLQRKFHDAGMPFDPEAALPPPPLASVLCEALFPRTVVPGLRPYSPAEIVDISNRHHSYYVHTMIHAYNSLRAALNRFLEHVLQPGSDSDGGSGEDPTAGGVFVPHLELPDVMTVDDEADAAAPDPQPAFRRWNLAPVEQRLENKLSPQAVAELIRKDVAFLAEKNFSLWTLFQKVIPRYSDRIAEMLKVEWQDCVLRYFEAFLFREQSTAGDRWKVADSDIEEVHAHISRVVRSAARQQTLPVIPLRDPTLFTRAKMQTVLFEQSFVLQSDEDRRVIKQGIPFLDDHFNARSPASKRAAPSAGADEVVDGGEPVTELVPDVNPASHMDSAQAPRPSVIDVEAPTAESRDDPPSPAAVAEVSLMARSPSIGADATPDASDEEGPVVKVSEQETVRQISALGAHPPPASSSSADPSASSRQRGTRRTRPTPEEELAADELRLSQLRESMSGKHLYVLVHGYQGNNWDMRMFKNRLLLYFPDYLFLCSRVNEEDTEGSIEDMGARLAGEVDEYVQDNCRSTLGRISIVCHSMGGIIARAALAHERMRPYVDKMYTFVSLAAPHCGYLFSNNSLLDTGMWFLRKWNKSVSLTQLSLSDHEDPYQCYLYKLSEQPGLEYFKNIFLVGSLQDQYAPFHSARIELHQSALKDTKRGPVYSSMVNNLLAPLGGVTLKRIDVGFVPEKKNLDSFIGRTAHIYFLDNQQYMVMLLTLLRRYFE